MVSYNPDRLQGVAICCRQPNFGLAVTNCFRVLPKEPASVSQPHAIPFQKPCQILWVFGQALAFNLGKSIFGTVVQSDAERRVVVTGSVENTVRIVIVFVE